MPLRRLHFISTPHRVYLYVTITKGEHIISEWFRAKKWKPAAFQFATMQAYLEGKSGLLNAPTGSGKTYALFLPVLADHINKNPDYKKRSPSRLRLLWITPLRALAKDIQRNLQAALDEMEIPWKVGIRTGDISAKEKAAQEKNMPDVLLTTPESLHLFISKKDNARFFSSLEATVVDEWHELLGSKRGVQAELGLAYLRSICPQMLTWGISATIGNIEQALQVITGKDSIPEKTTIIRSDIHKKIIVESVLPDTIEKFPWAGHLGIHLLDKVMPVIRKSESTLIFTNTRSQTEIWYRIMMERYPEMAGITALHHGSLDGELRAWVEENLHAGKLKLVICTSSLDLGVDFRPVDTVIQVGSPKSVSRFLQRAGRSGHQPDATSKIYFLPTHSLELIEAVSLRDGVKKNCMEERVPVIQAFDVLAQYMITRAVGDGFREEELYREIKSTYAYQFLQPDEWKWLLGFITTGSPSLVNYDEFKKVDTEGGLYIVKDRRTASRHRLSIGTIASDSSLRVKYLGGKFLGVIEESFIARMKPGDIFSFAGANLEFINVREMTVHVRKAGSSKGSIPRWAGGRVPLSSELSAYIRQRLDEAMISEPIEPEMIKLEPLLKLQEEQSCVPRNHQLLIERCSTREGYHIFIYPFEGRLVHEGIAALLAFRISQVMPVTFSMAMNDYGFELLSDTEVRLEELLEEHDLFSSEDLLNDIQRSVNATEMARRKFREIASVAGLVFQGYPGHQVKTRHLQASSSLLFEVIGEHEPENLLIKQAYQEALDQQLEEKRLRKALNRIHQQEFVFTYTAHPTPFAFPILVDRLREQVTSEKLEDRVNKIIAQFEKPRGNKNKK